VVPSDKATGQEINNIFLVFNVHSFILIVPQAMYISSIHLPVKNMVYGGSSVGTVFTINP
jgi:hypothetical protein